MATAWRRLACLPPSPNSLRRMARRRPRGLPRGWPCASATANSRSIWPSNKSAHRRRTPAIRRPPTQIESTGSNRWHPMLPRLYLLLSVALTATAPAVAQTPIRTETIRPAAPAVTGKFKSAGRVPAAPSGAPEVIADSARLPSAVAQTRDRILAAARTGNIQNLAAVVRLNETVISLSGDRSPVAYWKANYPDSEGVEVLAILITILKTPFVHVDQGTPQEVYVWPYFARMPLQSLSPEQRVELFRIVTSGDYKQMLGGDAYMFFRLGIAPDGSWQFFVTGN